MSNILKAKKGDIQVLVNPLTKQFELIQPHNLQLTIDKLGVKKLGALLLEHEQRITTLEKENKKLNEEYLKFKDDTLKTQSDNLILFNKMNNTIETLLKKVNKLENEVSTLLSMNTNKE